MTAVMNHQNKQGYEELRKRLQKTTLCRLFPNGECKRGKHCAFAHGAHELAQKPDYQKTTMCISVKLGQPCRNGPSCRFAHSKHELIVVSPRSGRRLNAAAFRGNYGGPAYRQYDEEQDLPFGRIPMSHDMGMAHGIPTTPTPTNRGYTFHMGNGMGGQGMPMGYDMDSIKSSLIQSAINQQPFTFPDQDIPSMKGHGGHGGHGSHGHHSQHQQQQMMMGQMMMPVAPVPMGYQMLPTPMSNHSNSPNLPQAPHQTLSQAQQQEMLMRQVERMQLEADGMGQRGSDKFALSHSL